MKLDEIVTQDLMRFGLTPQRQDLQPTETYFYPPFHMFCESGDSYLPITWKQTSDGITGTFSTPEYTYEIQIIRFSYIFNEQQYNCANVAFVTLVDGKQVTTLVPTNYPQQVFGTVMNGVGEKVITLKLDAITMVATNTVDKRIKLYNRLADKYLVNFGNVYKNIKTLTGKAVVIISHRVPVQIQKQLYDFALEQSTTKN